VRQRAGVGFEGDTVAFSHPGRDAELPQAHVQHLVILQAIELEVAVEQRVEVIDPVVAGGRSKAWNLEDYVSEDRLHGLGGLCSAATVDVEGAFVLAIDEDHLECWVVGAARELVTIPFDRLLRVVLGVREKIVTFAAPQDLDDTVPATTFGLPEVFA